MKKYQQILLHEGVLMTQAQYSIHICICVLTVHEYKLQICVYIKAKVAANSSLFG